MKLAIKLLLFALAVAGFLFVVGLGGMLVSRHGVLHLAGDYYFEFYGGNQTSIVENGNELGEIVISEKVEEFLVKGDEIFVTRRPLPSEEIGEDREGSRLVNACEFYKIDVINHRIDGPFSLAEVRDRAEWRSLKEGWANPDYGKTICKLTSVWEKGIAGASI